VLERLAHFYAFVARMTRRSSAEAALYAGVDKIGCSIRCQGARVSHGSNAQGGRRSGRLGAG